MARFRAARAVHLGCVMSPLALKALATRECSFFAKDRSGYSGFTLKVILALQVVKLIQGSEDSFSSVGVLMADVKQLMRRLWQCGSEFC